MGLSSGTRLGPDEILAPLGAGGMGEVYRARDTRLERSVAIKVLPAHLSSDPDLRQRLEREARAISSLQHPNICVLHDIGHQDGTDFLVMEYLEGETLADRLNKGPLSVDQAIHIGIEIADALEKAHRQGITHRDLKPGNIMLTKSGAKLMDFGLAKPAVQQNQRSSDLVQGVTPSSPTSPLVIPAGMTTPLTVAGSLVGTFQYMAPEQIDGKEADARSDIFAFGAVLYEMLTGKRAFEGKSQISVASAILEKDPPPVSQVQAAISPALEHVISRALNKDPEKRWQNAADLREELEWARQSSKVSAEQTSLRTTSSTAHRPWLLPLVSLIALAGLGLAAVSFWTRPPEPRKLVVAIPPPDDTAFDLTGDVGAPPAISPDGSMLAFGAGNRIWLRSLDTGETRALDDTQNSAFPFWSPDSRKLGFFSGGKLRIVDISGGTPLTICDAANPRGGSWSSKGVIIFTPNIRSPLYQVPVSGGPPAEITTLDSTRHSTHRWPQFLPDGEHFLYLATNHTGQREFSGVYLGSLKKSNQPDRLLVRTDANGLYASGYLLYLRGAELFAQRFNPSRLQLEGDAIHITERVLNDQGIWRGLFTASQNGELIYTGGANAAAQGQLTWFDRNGKVLGTIGDRGSNSPRLSPDGRRLAIEFGDPSPDIWIFDTVSGIRTRLSTNATASDPIWSRDGKNIVYLTIPGNSNKARLGVRAADGTGVERGLQEEDQWQSPTDWSPDGNYILYDRGEPGSTDIFAMPVHGSEKPFPVIKTPAWERGGVFSPDGRWIAYSSRESGRDEVYVTPFPGPGPKWQVSTSGASSPRWRRDGKALYAINGDTMLEISISIEDGSIQAGEPVTLFQTAVGQTLLFDSAYDVAADGRILLNSLGKSRVGTRALTLIINWTEGLGR